MKKIIISTLIIMILAVGGFVWLKFFNQPKQMACTKEAMICPDGSFVGRTGQNCEFAPCPPQNSDYKDISYVIDGKEVVLKDGVSELEIVPGSSSKQITQYFGNEVKADFNGNGLLDIAFLLTQNSGGSGTFYYIAAALNSVNGYKGTNVIFLGDRIAPQATEFQNGEIIVNYADRKPNEPMTATPSVGVSRYFKISDGELTEMKN